MDEVPLGALKFDSDCACEFVFAPELNLPLICEPEDVSVSKLAAVWPPRHGGVDRAVAELDVVGLAGTAVDVATVERASVSEKLAPSARAFPTIAGAPVFRLASALVSISIRIALPPNRDAGDSPMAVP